MRRAWFSLFIIATINIAAAPWLGPVWFYKPPLKVLPDLISPQENFSGLRSENELRVLTLNIHHGRTTDDSDSLSRIAKIIADVNPDIVCLQEVDRNTMRSGKVDQASELGTQLAMHVAFGRAKNVDGGDYGNAILSRWPIEKTQVIALPSGLGREPRSALCCFLLLESGESLGVVSTHFDFWPNSSTRIASARTLNQFVDEHRASRFLLAGDLNSSPSGKAVQELRRSWSRLTCQQPTPTFPSRNPTRQLDYLFCHPSQGWQLHGLNPIPTDNATDHQGLLDRVELRARSFQEDRQH